MSILARVIGISSVILGIILIGTAETNKAVFGNEDIPILFGIFLIAIGILLMTR